MKSRPCLLKLADQYTGWVGEGCHKPAAIRYLKRFQRRYNRRYFRSLLRENHDQ